MAGTTITVDASQAHQTLGTLLRGLDDPRPALKIIGATVMASVQRNFEVGGRPQKWAPLSERTLKKRKSTGGPLVVQGWYGGLLGSIHYEVQERSVTVGTDKIYGALHQFGAAKGKFGNIQVNVRAHTRQTKYGAVHVRAHTRQMQVPWGDIPARPYLLIQDQDWDDIYQDVTGTLLPEGQKGL